MWNPFDSAGQRAITTNRPKSPASGCSSRSASGRPERPDPDRELRQQGQRRRDLRSRLATPLTNLKLKLAWYIIDFDNEAKVWYEAAFVKDSSGSDASLSGRGGQLQIFIASTPEKIAETLDVGVYRFELEVLPPDDTATTLEFASGPSQKLVRLWKSGD